MRRPRSVVIALLVAVVLVVVLVPLFGTSNNTRAGRAAPALPTSMLHPPSITVAQLREFEHVIDAVRGAGVRLPPLHAANSAGSSRVSMLTIAHAFARSARCASSCSTST